MLPLASFMRIDVGEDGWGGLTLRSYGVVGSGRGFPLIEAILLYAALVLPAIRECPHR